MDGTQLTSKERSWATSVVTLRGRHCQRATERGAVAARHGDVSSEPAGAGDCRGSSDGRSRFPSYGCRPCHEDNRASDSARASRS